MEINQKFIPVKFTTTRPGIKMTPLYITIHETDNTAKGANDEAHANLQANGNSREASWHYQVDMDSIWQSLPDNEVGWHAGDGKGQGNMASIGIEICVNSDGDYKKACINAAWLVQQLMAKHNIGIDRVVQHNKWSGKNCPRHLRAGDWGVTWAAFINLCKDSGTKNGWKKENAIWYFYENNVKKTGWIKDAGKWYYLNPHGDMRVGWVQDGDKWYFLAPNGEMKTGWIQTKNKWYYLKEDGSMATGRYPVNGKWYFLQSDGALLITDKDGVITNG